MRGQSLLKIGRAEMKRAMQRHLTAILVHGENVEVVDVSYDRVADQFVITMNEIVPVKK